MSGLPTSRRFLFGPGSLPAFVVAIAAAVGASCSPPAGPSEPSTEGVSLAPAATLEEDLAALAGAEFAGRGAGTAGGRLAGAYLRDRLAQAGLRPAGVTGYDQPFTAQRGDTALEALNLIAVVPNRRLDRPAHDPAGCSHPLVVLTAHYDHLGTRGEEVFNGADDNASGVAAALSVAGGAVGDDTPFHLLLALLDAEEVGLQGAMALLEHWPPEVEERIVANLNLDMVGRSDGGILWIAGASHTPWLEPVVGALEDFDGIEVRAGRDRPDTPPDWTESSDHAVFHRAGLAFLYFGVDDHADYHRPTDDVEKIDLVFLRAVGDVVRLALARIEERLLGERIEATG